ncbi:MAG: S8 family serine peptidase [Methanosarcinales archaeon]|nr:S8 family serine peptidase [Methanosarcinales archaeon]
MSLQGITDNRKLLAILFLMACLLAGCIDSPGDGVRVITLGASDCENHIAEFSGSGPTRDGRTKPTVVAPGVDVVSTVPPGLSDPNYLDVYYARESGTSLSTPVAAGVAALLLQKDPSMTPAGIKAAMTRGARKINNTLGEEYEEYYQGAGLIDAYSSLQLLSPDICGVMPDRWVAGRWAFPGGGKAISPGLDIGADRPQKKLYALAPRDEDWTTRFVFFTNRERNNLTTSAVGELADWITLQPLPHNVEANGQKVFGATLTVPNNTAPGSYSGRIEISDGQEQLVSLPVSAEVARPFEIINGIGTKADMLDRNQWHYYYLDVPLGTSELDARLTWKGSSDLDLFILSPTSEYLAGEQTDFSESYQVTSPSSGRWLMAVHAREISAPEKYVLQVDRPYFEVSPERWNVGSVLPREVRTATFRAVNQGAPLEDVVYRGILENTTSQKLEGSVVNGSNWTRVVDVADNTRRLSLELTWDESSSDLDLHLYNPEGELAGKSEGYDVIEGLEVINPDPGPWKVNIYGFEVPRGRDQRFRLAVAKSIWDDWPWISASGPRVLESGEEADLEVELAVPPEGASKEMTGYLEIRSGNQTFELPVILTVAGASIEGLNETVAQDLDGDGYFDLLNIRVDVQAPIPGSYRLEGTLIDCSGNVIQRLQSVSEIEGTDGITLQANGSEIWKKGRCSPLRLEELFLYNDRDELMGIHRDSMSIDRTPESFQPPAAYFNGSFTNQSQSLKQGEKLRGIAVAVGVGVSRSGEYVVEGTLKNEDGVELDRDSQEVALEPGNHTVVLQFSPAKFMIMGEESRLILDDLILTSGGQEIDRLDEVWSTGSMRPRDFTTERARYVVS